MKISEYPEVTSMLTSDRLLIEGDRGTKSISAESLAKDVVEMAGGVPSTPTPDESTTDLYSLIDSLSSTTNYGIAQLHRSIYRGKFLGNSFNDDQKTAVQMGNFNDLFLGDYWNINGTNWVIADFDYWMDLNIYSRNETIYKHHLAIIPSPSLNGTDGYPKTYAYEEEDLSTKGYILSKLRTAVSSVSIQSLIESAFGQEYLLKIPEYLTCRKEHDSHFDVDSQTDLFYELPTLYMLTGMAGFLTTEYTSDPRLITGDPGTGRSQLALFRVSPDYLITQNGFWTRTLVGSSSKNFVVINKDGLPTNPVPGNSYELRPFFGITGESSGSTGDAPVFPGA